MTSGLLLMPVSRNGAQQQRVRPFPKPKQKKQEEAEEFDMQWTREIFGTPRDNDQKVNIRGLWQTSENQAKGKTPRDLKGEEICVIAMSGCIDKVRLLSFFSSLLSNR